MISFYHIDVGESGCWTRKNYPISGASGYVLSWVVQHVAQSVT